MQEETDTAKEAAEQTGPLAGQRLAEARQKKQISVAAVAKELHIDEAKISAIEENRFGELGAAVYAKGYLRRYAEYVGADSGEIFADYYRLTREQGIPVVVVKDDISFRKVNMSPWMVVVGLLVVVACVLFWWLGRAVQSDPATPSRSVSAQQDAPNLTVQLPANEPVASETESAAEEFIGEAPVSEEFGDVAPASSAELIVVPEATPVVTNTPLASEMSLQLTFSGNCWTEIKDANGRALFVDLAKEGSTRVVSGVPPIRVLLGDSQNVRIKVNGTDYEVPEQSRSGLTARFTIEKQ